MIFHIVYQGGIANVFKVPAGNLGRGKRVLQTTFDYAEGFGAGAMSAGAEVYVWSANVAGDVATATTWTPGHRECPFRREIMLPDGVQIDNDNETCVNG